MSALTVESLGLTREEIIERVVARLASEMLETHVNGHDEDGRPTSFAKRLERKAVAAIDLAVARLAEQYVLPNVAAYIDSLCLTETNKWGEKKGASLTFVEYLIGRAEAYLREEVDYNGKVRGQDTYSWKSSGTRVAWMIHQHLQYSIQTAMEQALKTANAAIVGGIESAVKIKLAEVAASLKVTAKIGG